MSNVHVRMYRQGLGDCFLLTLPTSGERPFYMMIDCGVIVGTPEPEAAMKRVVGDIIKTTGGHVDLLVVTHEHWDHLSGFLQAAELFATGGDEDGKLHIHDLWLAWTEDSKDDLARLLRSQRKKTEHGLRLALQALRAAEQSVAPEDPRNDEDDSLQPISQQVEGILGFFGATSVGGTSDALEAARTYARGTLRYCRPDDAPITLPDVPGIRFYVLGPPRDEQLIKRSRPSRAHSEVYEAAFAMTPENAFFAGALDERAAAEGGFTTLQESSQPFDRAYSIPQVEAKQLPFFKLRYWGDSQEADYQDQSWRRIDAEWLGAAANLALKLDDDTNNTSLALAIELVDSGKVLLFPGDAQVGNWLSWEDVSWTDDDTTVSAHDLLARTVLYKVGHHGSHNATLRDKGLELMGSEELVALVPVDHETAKKKGWFKIPFAPLLARLHEKAQGRVLRSDGSKKVKDQPPPDGVSAAAWRRYQERVEETDLYFEVRVGS